MAVRFDGNVHLFQLEVVEMAGEGAAMAQLKARRYTEKHRGSEEPIHVEPTRPKKIDQGANAPWTPQETKKQGPRTQCRTQSNVLATRKPVPLTRIPAGSL